MSELTRLSPRPASTVQLSPPQLPSRPFHPRRSHKKSRNGCQTCKRRRVKCDETRPKCNRCIQQEIDCVFAAAKPSNTPSPESDSNPSGSAPSPHASCLVASMSNSLSALHLEKALEPPNLAFCAAVNPFSHGYLPEMMHHFVCSASGTIGSPAVPDLMRKKILPLSQQFPFLLHAIIAFTTHHLTFVRPQDGRFRLLANYHGNRALQLYSNELSSPVRAEHVDAIFATCMLITSMAYEVEDEDPANSWIFSRPEDFSWFQVIMGFRVLLRSQEFRPHIRSSFWFSVIQEADDAQGSFSDIRDGIAGLPQDFVELCGLDSSSTIENNPYHMAVRLLAPLMTIQPCILNFTKFISFPSRMRPEFYELVHQKDPMALLILGYWFGQMCSIRHWWAMSRARRECLAICTYLDGWPDERITTLLEYPIQACGYTKIDKDAINTLIFGM